MKEYWKVNKLEIGWVAVALKLADYVVATTVAKMVVMTDTMLGTMNT